VGRTGKEKKEKEGREERADWGFGPRRILKFEKLFLFF
jgi:hypothetical protein